VQKWMMWTITAALAACTSEGAGGEVPAEPTYHRDVAPLLAEHCESCHVEGGIAPFSLAGYANAERRGEWALRAIEAGRMPPWMPAHDCGNPFENERRLDPEEVATFAAWVDQGMREGDPADAPPPPEPPPMLEPTHSARDAEGYIPDAERPDDYRCFVLDLDFPETKYLVGSQVVPDVGALVHHVLVYAVPPSQVEQVMESDAAEEGPGYTCFGGPTGGTGEAMGMMGLGQGAAGLPTLVGAWVPGQVPRVFEDGRGIRIEAGSRIVMQAHYNLLSADPQRDATEFAMQLTDTPPTTLVDTRPLPILDLDIPAGEANAVHEETYRYYGDDRVTIRSMAAHMHLLGTELRADFVPASGETDACMIDIPEWDFDWQQSYGLSAENAWVLEHGDGVRLRCDYDNTMGNQPVINGEQVEPRDVQWGEGTLDEMCLLYLDLDAPFEAAAEASCGDALNECLTSCEGDSDVACLMRCEASIDCQSCVLGSALECAMDDCTLSFLGALSCLRHCAIGAFVLGGDIGECMESECASEHAALVECVEPVWDSGACDEAFAACTES